MAEEVPHFIVDRKQRGGRKSQGKDSLSVTYFFQLGHIS
jgi:hypothetical protein